MLAALLLALVQAAAVLATAAVAVPVQYDAARIIARPRTADGQTLNLWVDTGGGGGAGMYLLTDEAVRRLHLDTGHIEADGQSIPVADPPKFAPGAAIPPPAGKYDKAIVVPANGFRGPGDSTRYDGMLGAGYLPGNPATHARIWTFDYPGGRLTLEGANWQPSANAHATRLHFPLDKKGRLEAGFARIVVRVDGQPLSLLLDTGATAYPTPAALAAEGGRATVRATSFITTTQLESWHKAHPDWRVIADADRMKIKGKPMRAIEVPAVEIAGWLTGPVWFTERPDTNFHDFMSSMMDAQVEGALGGNAFEHFAMSVDYGRAKAYFRCVSGCVPASGP
ncbi:MAG TPA: hypothetical protein VFX38_06670 [Gammaproteobacteria bacterium]|nr:hypothetical protein [Gammaproteobacteria bacterium]